MRAKEEVLTSEAFVLIYRVTRAEAYRGNDEVVDVGLGFRDSDELAITFCYD